MSDIEKTIIEKILKKNDYNVSKAARELSISRQNLQYKIKIHKIVEEFKLRFSMLQNILLYMQNILQTGRTL